MSPEKLGFSPVKTLVTARSAIGVIWAIAEVNMVKNCVSELKFAIMLIIGIVRLLLITLAVIVTEKLLFAEIEKIGSCSAPRLNKALFNGVIFAF